MQQQKWVKTLGSSGFRASAGRVRHDSGRGGHAALKSSSDKQNLVHGTLSVKQLNDPQRVHIHLKPDPRATGAASDRLQPALKDPVENRRVPRLN